MAAIQLKDANSARQIEGPFLFRNSRPEEIAQLVQQSVRSQQVEDNLYWVVLNLPNQTSCTLYLGSSKMDASLIEATARGAVAHALEYAFSASGKPGSSASAAGLLAKTETVGSLRTH